MAAIYMWFEGGDLVVTTTPYPLEQDEYLQLEVSVDDMWFMPISTDYRYWDEYRPGGGFLQDIAVEFTTDTEYRYFDEYKPLDGLIQDILIEVSAGDDYRFFDEYRPRDGVLRDIIIYARHDTEGLQLAVDVEEIDYVPDP